MNKSSTALSVLSAALCFGLLTACGGGGGAAADADTPEGQAFLYRQAVMRVAANKLATIGGMVDEEIPVDEEVFTKATQDLAAVSGMIVEGFELEGVPTGSRALPDIWASWDDFEQMANDSAEAAQALAEAAAQGGFAAGRDLVQPVRQACGACHRAYRERAAE